MEFSDIVAEDVEVCIQNGDAFIEDGIELAGLGEELLREAGEDDVLRWKPCAEAGQLGDLFGCEVGADVVFE